MKNKKKLQSAPGSDEGEKKIGIIVHLVDPSNQQQKQFVIFF